jgi:hypothetical protein
VINASKSHEQKLVSEQPHGAVESRVVIGQAEGITAQHNTVPVNQAY